MHIEEMRRDAEFIDLINREVFKGGLMLQAVENPDDISTIVSLNDKEISRLYLEHGIGEYEGTWKTYPGSFSEEMDSPERTLMNRIKQLDPIDGTGDLKKSTSREEKDAEFRKRNGITRPYGATNLVSSLERNDSGLFVPKAGMIFDFIDQIVIIGDGKTTEMYRIDKGKMTKTPFSAYFREYRDGEPIHIGKRVAYPHMGFEKFLEYLRDEKKLDLHVVTVGGAGRWAEQLFRTNMFAHDLVPDDYTDSAIDVVFNYQDDHKTWDLDPVLAIHKGLCVTRPTDVYGDPLSANAAYWKIKPRAWHTTGYLYSAKGAFLHHLMARYAREFERDTKISVLDKAVK